MFTDTKGTLQQLATHCLYLSQTVTDDKTGLPTDQLSESAIIECRLAGSAATTVTDIIQGRGDANVLKLIKRGIDEANKKAIAKPHKVQLHKI